MYGSKVRDMEHILITNKPFAKLRHDITVLSKLVQERDKFGCDVLKSWIMAEGGRLKDHLQW